MKLFLFLIITFQISFAYADPEAVGGLKRQGDGGMGNKWADKLYNEAFPQSKPESTDTTKGHNKSQRRMDEVDGGSSNSTDNSKNKAALIALGNFHKNSTPKIQSVDPKSKLIYPVSDDDYRPVSTKSPCPRIDIVRLDGGARAALNINGRTIGHMSAFDPSATISQQFRRGQVAILPNTINKFSNLTPISGDNPAQKPPCTDAPPLVWQINSDIKKLSSGNLILGNFQKFELAQDINKTSFSTSATQLYFDKRQAISRIEASTGLLSTDSIAAEQNTNSFMGILSNRP